MRKLYSHPGIPLIDHLEAVANGCKKVVVQKRLNLGFEKRLLEDLLFLAGAFHDFGKATSYFQRYLQNPNQKPIGPKHHALISSLLVKVLSKSLIEHFAVEEITKEMLPHFLYVVVKRHHGSLQNFDKEFYIDHFTEDLRLQVNSIHPKEAQELIDHFLQDFPIHLYWKDFVKYIEEESFVADLESWIDEYFEDDFLDLSDPEKANWYYIFQFLYGTLLIADKRDVIIGDLLYSTEGKLSYKIIDKFREKKGFNSPTTEINQLKNQAFFETIENLTQRFQIDQHLYSLTLPTGLGKTIISFAVALKIQEDLLFQDSKIIIGIPFTSIIDQNYLVYQEIIGANDSSLLLKHHHLSEPKYNMDKDELSIDKSQFLIETWESEIVVTTFVQIIEAFFSNDKSKVLKIPQIVNSVVILDEVQNIPYKMWELLRVAFQTIGKLFNTFFVFMSATQPLIFKPREEIIELVPEYEEYFESELFKRTILLNKTIPKISVDEFYENLYTFIEDYPSHDVLVILNTKDSSRACFSYLCNRINDSEILFLSTLVTPFERKRIIDKIKNEKSDKRRIIVSTQLIEAGVDISVDTVFRVLSPLDSVIQAAGRANRYNEKNNASHIYLYEIEEFTKVSSRIYGPELLQNTRITLTDISEAPEPSYLRLIQKYFEEIQKQSYIVSSKEKQHLENLNFKDLGEFQFIEDQKTESVFIQINSNAVSLWNEFTTLFEREDLKPFEKKNKFAEFKAQFYDFVINVPIPCGSDEISFDRKREENGFYLSTLEKPSKFYTYSPKDFSQNQGYVVPSSVSF